MKDDNDNENDDIEQLPNQEITVIISNNGETRNIRCNLRESIKDICKFKNIDKYYLPYY